MYLWLGEGTAEGPWPAGVLLSQSGLLSFIQRQQGLAMWLEEGRSDAQMKGCMEF